jgi:YidC/Oxa1 family membrane protein insertase
MLSLPYHLVMALTSAFSGGVAIILFTVAVRAALLPLAIRAARGERARAAFAPKLNELRTKHGDDREAFATDATSMMRASGTTPFAGMLPAALQIPFFMVLYRLFNASTVDGRPNGLLGQSLLGVHLGTRFMADPGAPVFWLVFAALAVIAWYAGRRLRAGEGTMAKVMRAMPFFTVLVAGYVPLAAGLYLVASTAWTAIERTILAPPASPALPFPDA